jgi:putative ABC transport system permease protein
VISHSVAQRTQEIGVRLALGASPLEVLKMIVGQGTGLTLVGVAVGLIGALATGRLLGGLLYGVKSNDPQTLTAVALLLVIVSLVASYLPARRATRIDPMVALRYE